MFGQMCTRLLLPSLLQLFCQGHAERQFSPLCVSMCVYSCFSVYILSVEVCIFMFPRVDPCLNILCAHVLHVLIPMLCVFIFLCVVFLFFVHMYMCCVFMFLCV